MHWSSLLAPRVILRLVWVWVWVRKYLHVVVELELGHGAVCVHAQDLALEGEGLELVPARVDEGHVVRAVRAVQQR